MKLAIGCPGNVIPGPGVFGAKRRISGNVPAVTSPLASNALSMKNPSLGNSPAFDVRVNVNVAEIKSNGEIRLRVWERGTGITQACGTGACATLVAAASRGLTDRKASILMDGGKLSVEWDEKNRIILSGPTETAFSGEVDLPLAVRQEDVA